MEEVDYTSLSSHSSHFSKKESEFERAIIVSNMINSFPKRQVHIYCMSLLFVPSFKLIVQKLWKKLIIQHCHPEVVIS